MMMMMMMVVMMTVVMMMVVMGVAVMIVESGKATSWRHNELAPPLTVTKVASRMPNSAPQGRPSLAPAPKQRVLHQSGSVHRSTPEYTGAHRSAPQREYGPENSGGWNVVFRTSAFYAQQRGASPKKTKRRSRSKRGPVVECDR